MHNVRIASLACRLPTRCVRNDESVFAQVEPIPVEWWRFWGIESRYMIDQDVGETELTLPEDAAREALELAEIDAGDLDLVLFNMTSPFVRHADGQRRFAPRLSRTLRDRLGAKRALDADVDMACASFVLQLQLAVNLIKDGRVKRALVCSSERMSDVFDYTSNSSTNFGDGAAAAVLVAEPPDPPGANWLKAVYHSDATHYDLVTLPERVVDNHEVAMMIETSDTFIRERTGVVSRRYLAPGQHLACPASERAMADAGVSAQDVDLLIVNTLSPDHHDPSQACYLQPRLGLREIPCFDIRAQCSDGLYGIEIARHFVASGLYRNVLLVCAEALSRRVDTSLAGRNLSVLLGDGAAALLLRSSPDPAVGLLDLILGADGTQFDLLCTEAPGARRPCFIDAADVAEGRHQFRMHGAAMFDDATRRIVDACCQMLERRALTIPDIGLVVPHQTNLRILDHVIAQLGLPRERCVVTVDQLGNMASASFLVALAIAREQRRLTAGQLNLFVTYGAGATWACALYRS